MFGRKSGLERRLEAVNPYAATPSTRNRERAARRQQRQARTSSVARAVRALRPEPKPRWPW